MAGLAPVAVGGLWLGLRWFLASDRGLDVGDEGVYLISADPPSSSAAWMFPAGWHTAPLYALSRYDIGNFRTLGAIVLVFMGALLGLLAVSSVRAGVNPWLSRTVKVNCALAGASASLLYYVSLLRTPSYNWVNLVGLIVASIGIVLESRRADLPSQGGVVRAWVPAAIVSIGAFTALAAKPTSSIAIVVLYFAVVTTWQSAQVAGARTLAVLTGIGALVGMAVIVRLWPTNFVSVFLEALAKPRLTDDQTPVGALQRMLGVPGLFYTDIRGEQWWTVALIGLGGGLLLFGALLRPLSQRVLLLCLLLLLMLGVYVMHSDLALWHQAWEEGHITTGLLLVTGSYWLFGLASARRARGLFESRVRRRSVMVTATGLAGLAFVYGLGSANTPYFMAKFAAVLFAGSAGVALVLVPTWRERMAPAVMLAVLMSGAAWSLVGRSQVEPYSGLPMGQQTVATAVGSHATHLLLDAESSAEVRSLRDAVQANGGDKVRIVAVGAGTQTLSYVTGAVLPDSLFLTWVGQPGVEDLARHNVSRLDPTTWRGAWLLLGSLDQETEEVLTLFERHVAMDWPSDYELMARTTHASLWRPKESSTRDAFGLG